MRTSPSCGWNPRIDRSSVDLPEPLGPMIASQPPGSTVSRTDVQHPRPAVAGRQPDHLDARPAVHRRRAPTHSRPAKNGAPTKAVTTPMGSSAGASTTRATRSASTRKAPPTSSETGRTRACEPPTKPAGDVRDDQPDEADQPADRDGRGGGQRRGEDDQQPQPAGVHAQRAGLVVADGEHVEGAAAEQQHDAGGDQVGQHQQRRRTTARGRAGRAASRRPRAGRRCSAAGPGSARRRGRRRPRPRRAAGWRCASRRPPCPRARAQPTPTSAPTKAASGTTPNGPRVCDGRVGDDQGRAQPGAGGRAEQVRIGQRIAEDALVGRPGDRQPGADQRGEDHPRQPELRAGRPPACRSARRTGAAAGRPVEQGDDDGAGRQRERAHPDPGEQRQRPARARGRRAPGRAGGACAAPPARSAGGCRAPSSS